MNTVENAKIQMKKFAGELLDLAFLASDDGNISLDDRNWLYSAAQRLYPQISQILGAEYYMEGNVSVFNKKAMVKIGDLPVLKRMRFELLLKSGEWDTGYLDMGQYGLNFVGGKGTVVLTDGMRARIKMPAAVEE